jgi:hypothetical protein
MMLEAVRICNAEKRNGAHRCPERRERKIRNQKKEGETELRRRRQEINQERRP